MSYEESITVRELLRLSQTDVTLDPNQGLDYAAQAYEMAKDPSVRASDPTAMAEAAAKAGFRAEQADKPLEEVSAWFERSISSLPNSDPRSRRELVATYTLEGRALSLHSLNKVLNNQTNDTPELKRFASGAFENAEDILKSQHSKGSRWDRYATMSARHRATHEAVFGYADLAATTAVRGMWRAIRADREGKPSEEHRSFVKKHLIGNFVAGLLVVSRPIDRIPKVNAQRLKVAHKLLG
jgi:hypothetical protein